jgi:hypothetical protein
MTLGVGTLNSTYCSGETSTSNLTRMATTLDPKRSVIMSNIANLTLLERRHDGVVHHHSIQLGENIATINGATYTLVEGRGGRAVSYLVSVRKFKNLKNFHSFSD